MDDNHARTSVKAGCVVVPAASRFSANALVNTSEAVFVSLRTQRLTRLRQNAPSPSQRYPEW